MFRWETCVSLLVHFEDSTPEGVTEESLILATLA